VQLAAGASSFGFHDRRTALLLALPREYAFDGDGFDFRPNAFLFEEAIER
jgi:hypothetical protein